MYCNSIPYSRVLSKIEDHYASPGEFVALAVTCTTREIGMGNRLVPFGLSLGRPRVWIIGMPILTFWVRGGSVWGQWQ